MGSNNKESGKNTLKLGIKLDTAKVLATPSLSRYQKSTPVSVEVRKKKRPVSIEKPSGGIDDWIRSKDSLLTKDEQMSRLVAVQKAAFNKEQQPVVNTSKEEDDTQVRILEEFGGDVAIDSGGISGVEQQVIDSAASSILEEAKDDTLDYNLTVKIEEDVINPAIHVELEPKLGSSPAIAGNAFPNAENIEKQKDKQKKQHQVDKDEKKPSKGLSFNKQKASPIKLDDKKPLFEKRRNFDDGYSSIFQDDEDDEKAQRVNKGQRRKKQKSIVVKQNKLLRKVIISEGMNISTLAARTGESIKDISRFLQQSKLVEDRNLTGESSISVDNAMLVVAHFGHDIKKIAKSKFNDEDSEIKNNFEEMSRPPIVTILGHVDHGKTTLLDALRETDVTSSEHGGITQSIGAYQLLDNEGRKITFIDTPGHEAFSAMRMRGASVTDIVVLVVAADDGVKEQTIEAISHAKVANVPMIVAVNKMDKYGVKEEEVLRELLQYDVIVESFGGDVISVPVSAKTGHNLDKLKESILLLAEIMSLKAPFDGNASGVIIETGIDKGMGITASAIVKSGKLKVGDVVLVGKSSFGKVRLLIDSFGKEAREASVSEPVRIIGFSNIPVVGDIFRVVESEKQARSIISYNELKGDESDKTEGSDFFFNAQQQKSKEFYVIIKADTIGAKEAIYESLLSEKFNNSEEVKVKVIYSAVGPVSSSDVMLAMASRDKMAVIFSFNLPIDAKVAALAKQHNVQVHSHTVIYDLIDNAKMLLKALTSPKIVESTLGSAEVRALFSSNKKGSIVGCYVLTGQLKRGASIKIIRSGEIIHFGSLKVLKRFAEDVKEVKSGFECGVFVSGTFTPEVGDIIECFTQNEESQQE